MSACACACAGRSVERVGGMDATIAPRMTWCGLATHRIGDDEREIASAGNGDGALAAQCVWVDPTRACLVRFASVAKLPLES